MIRYFFKFVGIVVLCLCMGCIYAEDKNKKGVMIKQKAELVDQIAAVVNEEVITENQLNDRIERVRKEILLTSQPMPTEEVFRKQILQQLINQKLQLQVAKKIGIQISEEDIDQSLAKMAKKDNETVDQLYERMKVQGWTILEFREEVEKELTIQQLQDREVVSRISISKQEIDDFARTTHESPETMPEYHLANILIAVSATPSPAELQSARALAETWVKKLKAGANFSQVAQMQSSGSQALQGGDLGWRKLPELPTAFAAVVPSLKVGDIAGPIQAPNGFHIITLLGKHEPQVKPSEPEYEIRWIYLKRGQGEIQDNVKEEMLRNIRKSLEAGKPFASLAKRYSQDIQSAKNGGYIGWMTKSNLNKQFSSTISRLKSYEISQPIMTDKGWYLIQVMAERTHVQTSESQRKEVEQLIFQRKVNEEIEAFVNTLRSQAYIKVMQ